MLETIRQFAEEQLVASGEADSARAAHAHFFAGRESEILALWDSERQRESYSWFAVELPNLRAAFRWASDHDDLDTAATIAVYTSILGPETEQYEPITWAEEIIERAKATDHRRLAQLYAMAVQCYGTGRLDDFVRYSEAGQAAVRSGRFDEVPCEIGTMLGVGYVTTGQPELWADLCRNMLARRRGSHPYARSCLVYALTIAGEGADAVAASHGLLADAEVSQNPHARVLALLAFGYANSEADPIKSYEVLGRSLAIAQASGNRQAETHVAVILSRLAATHGHPTDALDFLTLAIRNFYDSGSFSLMSSPLAILTAFFDRLGEHQQAATISGFALNALTRHAFPEINTAITHLRQVLGEEPYESLARAGRDMTNTAIATYALDQIDLARAELP